MAYVSGNLGRPRSKHMCMSFDPAGLALISLDTVNTHLPERHESPIGYTFRPTNACVRVHTTMDIM